MAVEYTLDSPISHIVRGVYGEVTTPRAFGQIQIKGRAKVVEPRFMDKKAPATREAIRRNLRKGDIIAYARDKVLHKGVGNYEHMCIVVKIDPTKAGDVIGITLSHGSAKIFRMSAPLTLLRC